jgi:hypothetical protein
VPSPRKIVNGLPVYASRCFDLPKVFGRAVLSDFGSAVLSRMDLSSISWRILSLLMSARMHIRAMPFEKALLPVSRINKAFSKGIALICILADIKSDNILQEIEDKCAGSQVQEISA